MRESVVSTEKCALLARTMERKYASSLGDRNFYITVQGVSDGILATVLLANASGSFHYPVEGRIQSGQKGFSDEDAALFLVEYMDGYFEDYLTRDSDLFLPIDWNDFESDGRTFQLKGQILNLELEKMADAILSRSDSLLI